MVRGRVESMSSVGRGPQRGKEGTEEDKEGAHYEAGRTGPVRPEYSGAIDPYAVADPCS